MQKAFELLSANFNHLALQLSKKEYFENQQSIEEKGELLHGYGKYSSKFTKIKSEAILTDYSEQSTFSSVDEALRLAEKAFYISRCLEQESKLGILELVKSEEPGDKVEESSQNTEFPWKQLKKLNPHSRFGKVQIKKTLALFYQTHPLDVRKAMERYNVKPLQLDELRKAEQIRDKRSQLKQQVIAQSNQCQISLNDFKKLARRIYTNKLFRPTDIWCFNFIRKHRLDKRVARPFH